MTHLEILSTYSTLYSTRKQLLLPDHKPSPLASLASDKLLPSVNKVDEMVINYFFNITEHNGIQSIKF
jgi:uncharacterized protein (DUF2249 family)